MMTVLWGAIATLFAALLLSVWRLAAHRRELLRLYDQIHSFLNGEIASPAFSVKDDRFAMFENAVMELETRLKQSEENAREESVRSHAFVQDVSHQFKTPIAGLRMFCEMDESAHRPQKLKLVGRMEDLISSLLKLEKLNSDGYAFEFNLFSLRELALDVKTQFNALYPNKQITVNGDAGIRCDAHWMVEALINLIKNACEHTSDSGHIEVFIEQSGSEAIVRVEDDGGGVEPEALSRLFERFYRTGKPEHGQGVGLGLAIVKTIINKHHGFIRAANGGRGLVITLYLPILHDNLKKT